MNDRKTPVARGPKSAAAETRTLETVQAELGAKGVKYCLSAYVDVHGIPKAKAVPISHFSRMMNGSELFTGAAIDGLGQGPHDDELALFPDPDAITILPWRPDVAWAPGHLKFHDDPWPMCSRNVLTRQIERAAKLGFRLNLGIECEVFFVRKENGRIVPANARDTISRAAYDIVGLLQGIDLVGEAVSYMDQMGWQVHSFDHEVPTASSRWISPMPT